LVRLFQKPISVKGFFRVLSLAKPISFPNASKVYFKFEPTVFEQMTDKFQTNGFQKKTTPAIKTFQKYD
jgi:hypothetical protein